MPNFFTLHTIRWQNGSVKIVDQRALPQKFSYVRYTRPEQVADAIRSMTVRGAPAIGIAGAMGLALAAVRSKTTTLHDLMRELESNAELLRKTRPTGMNLFWGIDRVLSVARSSKSVAETKENIVIEVKRMEDEDVEANKRLGKIGADLVEDGDTVLTHCNAGALATAGYGTALGVIRAATEQGKLVKVLVPETRPVLQGSRLTAYELLQDGIDCTIIADAAVGHVISLGRVNKVIVGADRITRDGYVFNKIGTYQEAVLAERHGIPFYPAAPVSTFDHSNSKDVVPIEERDFDEIVYIRGRRIAPKGVPVFNPAFDLTPPELVTAIISDRGIIEKPLEQNIPKVIS